MTTRNANSDQFWYCEVCKRRTEHRIGDRDLTEPREFASSEWHRYGEMLVFQRSRVCSECCTPKSTVEMSHEEFRQLMDGGSKVDDLELFKSVVEGPLAKVM